MKKKLFCLLLACAMLLVCVACSEQGNTSDETPTPTITDATPTEVATPTAEPTAASTPTPTPKPQITEPVGDPVHVDAQQWLAYEISFESDTEYKNPVYTVTMDVTFTHTETGETLVLPAFWDGAKTWKVRFSLPKLGDWTYVTACSDDTNVGLHYHTGTVSCTAYTGDLDIYKHGFVKTVTGTRYFMYDDGTPFFYLGDTHWTLPVEEIDGIGGISQEVADQYGITSQFKHIMDYRAEQGYTVIQSQQLGWYTGATGNSWMGDSTGSIFVYGVNNDILKKFQELDRYFAYIAEKGLVHSHTQFAYPEELIESFQVNAIDKEKLDMLCRYWVARYSAYPVLWATTQEGDDDYYAWQGCTPLDNPWLIVMNSIAKYDPYDHPSTCHQENVGNTRVNTSIFGQMKVHSWYAAQWSANIKNRSEVDWNMLIEYWANPDSKPVVNYEGRYDHFWGGTFVARSQGWLAFLNGQFGYGYGIQPIWSIVWADYGEHTPTSDEVEEYERDFDWVEGLYSEAGQQLTYMKDFLTQFEWWNLVPCFNASDYYLSSGTNYSVATIENKLYLGYFYGASVNTDDLGSFTEMENAQYEIRWMNCRTGEWTDAEIVTIEKGIYKIPGKPDSGDWAVYAKLIEE